MQMLEAMPSHLDLGVLNAQMKSINIRRIFEISKQFMFSSSLRWY